VKGLKRNEALYIVLVVLCFLAGSVIGRVMQS
jgi:uncharacterized protein YneF (UPF0154 family)